MGAIAPINFEKDLSSPIYCPTEQGSKFILHPLNEILNGLLCILHPSVEIPNDAPGQLGAYCSTQDLFTRKIEILYGTGFIAPSKKMNLALAVVRKSKEPPPYLNHSQ